MVSGLSGPPITIEQYLAFESPEGYRDELINGKIIVSPEPKALHFDVAENFFELLKAACNTKIHKVAQRMNLRFPEVDSMPSPDVFVIERAEWQRVRAEEVYPDGAKLLLAEVISPSNRPAPLREKVASMWGMGLRLGWWSLRNKK